jgi:hypothetical protein
MNSTTTSNPNQTHRGGAANNPEHVIGNTINKVDQVSSITLLGMAVAGAIAIDLILAVII